MPIIALYLCVSCVPEVDPIAEGELEVSEEFSIDVPSSFDYSTHQQVEIEIIDTNPGAKYDVFVYSETDNYLGAFSFEDESGEQTSEELYREDLVNKLVYTGVAKNGNLKVSVTLPKYCSQVYVRRKDNMKYSAELVPVSNQRVVYNHANYSSRRTQSQNGVEDLLYCVNGSAESFNSYYLLLPETTEIQLERLENMDYNLTKLLSDNIKEQQQKIDITIHKVNGEDLLQSYFS